MHTENVARGGQNVIFQKLEVNLKYLHQLSKSLRWARALLGGRMSTLVPPKCSRDFAICMLFDF